MKKVNTIPNGAFIISLITFMSLLTILISIVLIPKVEGFMMIGVALFFIISVFYYI